MNIISAIAESFNFVIFHFCAIVNNFLQVNFTIVSFIIKFLEYLKGTLVLNIFSVLNILNCYYQDFVIFLYEVISVMQFLINITSNFLYKVYLKVIFIVFTVQEFVYIINQNILSFYMFLQFCVQEVYGFTTYFIHLIITSTLLLLQLGPNLLILLYEVIFYCLCYLITLARCFIVSIIENLCNIYYMSTEAVFSIPVKAYFGALLCIALYYQHRNICAFFRKYFAYLTFIIIYSGMLLSTWLRRMINTLAYIFHKVKLFFYLKKANTYNSTTDDSNLREHAKPLQKNFLQKHFQEVKNVYSKLLSPNNPYVVEEQIKQLQNELTAEREKHICVICFDKPRSIIFYPCRHLCVCDDCSTNLIPGIHHCPLCRSNVFDIYHVFT